MTDIFDGRATLARLNARYDELATRFRFVKKPIYMINAGTERSPNEVTAACYQSIQHGPALWVLSGVHGEEPAGPNAIAQNISHLGQLGQDIPLVILPLLNPRGYEWDWRYPDERRDWRVGHSVGDSDHYLPDANDPSQPRVALARSEIAAKVTDFVLGAIADCPPVLAIDHHEDEALERGYIYSQGQPAAATEVARAVIQILRDSDIPIESVGLTRFNEPIKDGVVVAENGQLVPDGSIDELLASERIIMGGRSVAKPGARASLVIETPTLTVRLRRRIEAHANILLRLRSLWTLANQ